jgi:hypothetical protein
MNLIIIMILFSYIIIKLFIKRKTRFIQAKAGNGTPAVLAFASLDGAKQIVLLLTTMSRR